MNPSLVHLLRVAGAGVIAVALGILAGPDVVNVLGKTDATYLALVLTPILSGLEHALTAQLKS